MLNRVTNFVISFSAKCCIIRISEFVVLSTMRHLFFDFDAVGINLSKKYGFFIYIAVYKMQ